MSIEPATDVLKKLSDPAVLQKFIEVAEKSLERDRQQLKKEHEAVMAERAKLPIWHQPMDASYWMRRFDEIGRRERALEKAKVDLRGFGE